MKFLALTLFVLAAAESARNVDLENVIDIEKNTAFGYITKHGAPLAEKIRKAEEEGDQNPSRIVGGSASNLGQFPYQVIMRSIISIIIINVLSFIAKRSIKTSVIQLL